MESVRKDVECFFGILKGRFRILKMPIPFHKKEEVYLSHSLTCQTSNSFLVAFSFAPHSDRGHVLHVRDVAQHDSCLRRARHVGVRGELGGG